MENVLLSIDSFQLLTCEEVVSQVEAFILELEDCQCKLAFLERLCKNMRQSRVDLTKKAKDRFLVTLMFIL